MGDLMTDNKLKSDSAADPIMDLVQGARRLKILVQVLELGLFDEIEAFGEPVTALGLSRKCGYNLDVTERLLNTLVCLKLLDKIKNKDGSSAYRNAASTLKYLTRSKRPSLIPVIMSEAHMILPMIDNLPRILKTGTSDKICLQMMQGGDTRKANSPMNKTKNVANKTPQILMPSKSSQPNPEINNNGNVNNSCSSSSMPADMTMMFLSCMDGLASQCAPAMARAFDLTGHKTTADLGGGSGCFAYELARVYSNMHVTVFDLPQTTQIARKLQPEDTKSRVKFVAGDFFKDSLPSADLFVLGHVIHDWDRTNVDVLLKNVYEKLPAGGSLLLLEKMLNEEKDGPETCVLNDLAMAMISHGKERSATEYRRLLEKHGFRNTQIKRLHGNNTYDVLLARKPF
ncbi:acetylserotonin O-methyltransferase-like [Gigantopelta aegis]|uniref:acetylserotonin O-methyltransferase-like n=1 Tax=Gigantopelta aegis TaxID=1735272 RepID=UPI001B88D31B|nr:acetylserotonin O-methyltransferase-like [Gigantopelta aegis]